MTASRRQLKFATLDDAVCDAEMLLAKGYAKVGNWGLAQVCGHLALWLTYPIDGFPKAPLVMRPFFWTFRNTIGPRMARKGFEADSMKPGLPTIPQSVPPGGGDAAKAVVDLRAALDRWTAHDGPLHPSPLFGNVSKEQWTKGHRIHCAHHLGFLVPNEG